MIQKNDYEMDPEAFARHAHAEQTRDDGLPYIDHPAAVVAILRRHGILDPPVIAAAWLHDVVEDTECTSEDITSRFGVDVSNLVGQLTNEHPPGTPFAVKHAALLEHARQMGDGAKLVKLADRLHNLSEMGVWEPARQERYANAALELVDAMGPVPEPGRQLAEEVRTLAQEFAGVR